MHRPEGSGRIPTAMAIWGTEDLRQIRQSHSRFFRLDTVGINSIGECSDEIAGERELGGAKQVGKGREGFRTDSQQGIGAVSDVICGGRD